MTTPEFLQPLSQDLSNIVHFIERIPEVPVTTDRHEMIERLEPYHRKEMEKLGLKWKNLRRAQQVHDNKVALVGDIGSNFPVEGVDGLVCSGVAEVCLGIYVADCAAVWIYDKGSQAKALLHSGKKGTEGNIVAAGIRAMVKYCKAETSTMVAVISPCIRPPHYEVDIPGTIIEQLKDAGVPAGNIFDSGLDTAANLERFYSYRTEQGNTGRMLALFGRQPGSLPL